MSHRTPEQITERAEYLVSHEAQIDALTRPGLSEKERLTRWATAVGTSAEDCVAWNYLVTQGYSAACSTWYSGLYKRSLFANLPGCRCPVMEKLPGVPKRIPNGWSPNADELRVFSRIQIERRFGE